MKNSSLRKKKCVVLLSGGLDSSTVLYYVIKHNFEPVCLIFDYSQRHKKEILAAKNVAKSVNAKYYVIKISFPWKGSALVDTNLNLPNNSLKKIKKQGVPITYVPARNIIFLSYAISLCEVIGARYIFYGANQIDYSGYPDCRKKFIKKFQQMVNEGTKTGVEGEKIKILAPLLNMSKPEIVNLAVKLKVPLELTWSCYQGGKKPCGKCDACKLRSLGFKKVGLKDPLCN